MPTSGDRRNPVEALAEEFLDRRRRGETPTLREYLERYPDLAEEIRDLFPALLMMEDLGDDSGGTTGSLAVDGDGAAAVGARLQKLGDYRILREIGRGGMGVVYEAEQESLGRRVALKVLSAGALLDDHHVRRFEREARAAAKLHHTNIVPVFGVGQQDGHHYYVMQFIAGLGLDLVLEDLRRLRHSEAGPDPGVRERREPSEGPAAPGRFGLTAAEVARSLVTGQFAGSGPVPLGETVADPITGEVGAASPVAAVDRSPSDPSSVVLPGSSELSALSDSDRRFYRGVARIGVQVAEALDYANRQGVLHRDIKPSNLLLDTLGNAWVADFGLAKTAEPDDLTHTGDILGTIRYMAPERFAGTCDARSDVYSLGLTLYELVALRPAYQAADRHALMERVLHEVPARLKKLAPSVPRDLETIIAKATARDPAGRYATAGALAEDLQRFVEDRPIRARQTGPVERTWRWCRRNPALAALWGALLGVLLAGTGIASYYAVRARAGERRALEGAELLLRRDYIGRVNLALSECLNNNVARSLELLDGCPVALRGWEWDYARSQCHLDLHTFQEPGESVNGVAFSPDSTRVASVSGAFQSDEPDVKGDLVVRDVVTGQEIFARRNVAGGFRGVAFSPDGRWIATGNASDLVICDATTGVERFRRPDPGNHGLPLLSLAYSPDGLRIVAGYGRFNDTRYVGYARLWDAVTAEVLIDRIPSMLPALPIGRAPDAATAEVLIDRTPGYRAGVHSVAFSPDGREVALASVGLVELWDLQATPRLVHALPGHTEFVWGVAYSPDGRWIATASRDAMVRLWDRATGKEIRAFFGHEGFVRGLAFSPDGRWLISASEDRSLRLWEVASGRPLADFHGHQGSASCVAFSPDGRLFASGGQDHAVKLWLATSSPQLTFTGHDGFVTGLAFSSDGRSIVSGAGSHSTRGLDYVIRWDATTGEPLEPSFEGCPEVWAVALHPDGRRLATACREGPVMVWDIDTGRLVWEQKGRAIDVYDAAYSPDGRWLASAGGNGHRPSEPGEVKLRDAETGREISTFVVPTAAVFGVAFSPDSRWLASGCADGIVRIWDTSDLAGKSRELPGHGGTVECVVFLPDGRLASAGGKENEFGEVKIWDLATARVLDLRGHTDKVRGLTSSPDGRRLATGSNDRTIKLWDTRTGEEVFTLRGHTAGVICVAFSPDGRRLASGSFDRTVSVRVWDTGPPASHALFLRGAESRARLPELPDNPFAP